VAWVEILRGVERRRRWELADKLRIVAEVETPGAVFAAVARRHDLSRGQLWNWRRQYRSGELEAAGQRAPEFLPVSVTTDPFLPGQADSPVPPQTSTAKSRSDQVSGKLEITLPNGASIRVDGTVDAALLKAAIAAARG
jgi:transposase